MRHSHTLLAAAWLAFLLALVPVTPAAAHDGDLLLLKAAEIDVVARAIALADPYLYLISANQLWIYDLSAPDAPKRLGDYGADNQLVDLAVQDNRVYAVSYEHLYVIDVSSPTSPTLIARLRLPLTNQASAVTVAGDLLYVLEWEQGDPWANETELRAFDLFDPAEAHLLSTITLPGLYRDDRNKRLFVQGETVYVLTWTQTVKGGFSHLTVVNVDDVGNLKLRFTVDTRNGFAMAPAADGVAFMSAMMQEPPNCSWMGPQALQSVQTNDSTPVLSPPRHYLGPCQYYSALSVTDDYLYAVDGHQLTVYAHITPDREEFLAAYATSWGFSDAAIEATEDTIVVADNSRILILRWAARADAAYLPFIQGRPSEWPFLGSASSP